MVVPAFAQMGAGRVVGAALVVVVRSVGQRRAGQTWLWWV